MFCSKCKENKTTPGDKCCRLCKADDCAIFNCYKKQVHGRSFCNHHSYKIDKSGITWYSDFMASFIK